VSVIAARTVAASVRTPSPRRAALSSREASLSLMRASNGKTMRDVAARLKAESRCFGMRAASKGANGLLADVQADQKHCERDSCLSASFERVCGCWIALLLPEPPDEHGGRRRVE
jgi:hypothetical protein